MHGSACCYKQRVKTQTLIAFGRYVEACLEAQSRASRQLKAVVPFNSACS